MDKFYLSKERLEELKQELETLLHEGRRNVADRLKRAKEYGDLSENSEYSEAKDEQAAIERRIMELEDTLKNAVIIKKAVSTDVVVVGSTIVVKDKNKSYTYQIVGSHEAMPEEGRISNESPFGKAFLGHSVGEEVKVSTPKGETHYTISKIE
jgi:transcription elongation factor GreA